MTAQAETPIESGAAAAPAVVTPGGVMRSVMSRVGLGGVWGSSTLKARALRGSFWTLFGYGAGQVITLAANLALAYFLFPAAFGVIVLARVVLQGLKMFSDVGIGPSIIQHERGTEDAFLDTAWTIQIIRGFILWAASIALAWPAATFYDRPELLWVLPACGFCSVIAGFNSPALFTANRKLALGKITVLGLIAIVISSSITVLAAWLMKSVWALVIGWWVASFLTMFNSHVFISKRRSRLRWEREAAGQLYRFGRWIFVSTMITFFAGQLDKLVLATWLEKGLFGVYGIATNLLLMPMTICGQLTAGVLYPVLTEHARKDRSVLEAKLLEAREIILPCAVLVVLGMVVGAPLLFTYLYDQRYADAAWITQLLALPTWFGLLHLSADRGIPALSDNRWLAVSNFLKLLVTAAAGTAGFAAWGLTGFILGMAAGTLAGHVVVQIGLARNGVHIVGQDVRYTLIVAAGGAAVEVLPRLAAGSIWATPHVLVTIAVGAAVIGPLGVWTLLRLKRRVVGT